VSDRQQAKDNKPKPISFGRMLISVIQASFGVQNRNNRERDFSQGRPIFFIIAALVVMTLFVSTLMFIVRLVISFQ
jgi:hypothetical protein